MDSFVSMVLAAPFILIGSYQYLNARRELEASLYLKGVDPQAIDQSGRESAIRRNKIVGISCVIIGLGILTWGLLT